MQRNQPILVALVKYLLHPVSIAMTDPIGEVKTPKQDILTLANRLSKRLFSATTTGLEEYIEQFDETEVCVDISKEEKLQKVIDAMLEQQPERELPKSLQQDFKMFEATKKRSEHLELLLQALLTEKPTSVKSERSLLVRGAFTTKIRSKLGDRTLSALVFF